MTSTNDGRRVLFICYAFPPVGGAGVQRSVKFVKYLSDYGWKPTVLTVENPSVPVLDEDLVADVPARIEVLRSRTWEPSYRAKASFASGDHRTGANFKKRLRSWVQGWLQPDMQVLWNWSAARKASRELASGAYSAIYVSGPPFSSFLMGAKLKRKFGLPLILDFRDEWSLSARYLENQSHRDRMLERHLRMFESTILQADAIVATTQASAEELQRCCDRVHSSAIVRCIYNGYDPADMRSLIRVPHGTARYRLVYTGTLWRLTDIEPLVIAIEQLSRNHPDLAEKLELHIIGRKTAEQELLLQRVKATRSELHSQEYLPHRQSLQLAKNADGLLLLLADEEGAERVVPAKIFEYLALQRPILGILPAGEVSTILGTMSHIDLFPPSAIDSVEAWLVRAIEQRSQRFDQGELPSTSGTDSGIEVFSRPQLTAQLAALLDEVTKAAN